MKELDRIERDMMREKSLGDNGIYRTVDREGIEEIAAKNAVTLDVSLPSGRFYLQRSFLGILSWESRLYNCFPYRRWWCCCIERPDSPGRRRHCDIYTSTKSSRQGWLAVEGRRGFAGGSMRQRSLRSDGGRCVVGAVRVGAAMM
jgi:hypothetical protein